MKHTQSLAAFTIGLSLFGGIAQAQLKYERGMDPNAPNAFMGQTGQKECEAALRSGYFRYYKPTYLDKHDRDPINNIDRVPVELEADLCVDMEIVGGRGFVVQKEGTKFRAHKLADGSCVLYARDDCGNRVFGTVLPPPLVYTPFADAPPSRRLITPPVIQQQAPVIIPPPYLEPVTPPALGSSNSRWGITAGAMIGAFDSLPIGGDGGMIESLAGQVVCAQGRTFDLGVAYGEAGSSLWRLTVVSKLFTKDSLTKYTCANCTEDVQIVADSGVRTLGVQLELVQGFNSKNWRKIRPMVSANIGVGSISGSVRRLAGPVGKPATRVEQGLDAEELFDSRWVTNAGVGVGVMGDLGDHVTYAVTAGGIEYPGRYFGRVSITVRP